MTTRKTTRRTIIVGAACVPALGSLVFAAGQGIDDPIFAAIDAHREAWANFSQLCESLDDDDVRVDQACDKAYRLLASLVSTTPTTIAGCAAALAYIDTVSRGLNDSDPDPLFQRHAEEVSTPGAEFMGRIAKVLAAQS